MSNIKVLFFFLLVSICFIFEPSCGDNSVSSESECDAGSGTCEAREPSEDGDASSAAGPVDEGENHQEQTLSPAELLVSACISGDLDKVKQMLDGDQDLVDNIDARLDPSPGEDLGLTALDGAAISGSVALIEELVSRGADVNGGWTERNSNDSSSESGGGGGGGGGGVQVQTPLVAACYSDQTDAALALLRLGASAQAQNRHNTTALHLAALYGRSDLVDALLAHGAVVTATDDSGYQPLHMAALAAQPAVIRKLLEAGADAAAVDRDGRTPLHHVCGSKPVPDPDMERPLTVVQSAVQLTEAAKQTVMVRDVDGCQPLHWCASRNHNLTVAHLAEQGSDVNARDAVGRTPLMRAFITQSSWSARVLLEELGASPNVADNQGDTPVHFAARNDYGQLMGRLLTRGGSTAARTAIHFRTGNSPLHEAAANGADQVFEVLLSVAAPVNEPNARGETPALLAARTGRLGGARCLWALRTAILKLVPGEPGHDALQAVVAGEPFVELQSAEYLASRTIAESKSAAAAAAAAAETDRESGSDQEVPTAWITKSADRPLLAACDAPDGRALTVLLSFLPDLEMRHRETGDTALHRCIRSRNVAGVKELLEHGALLDLTNEAGETPAGLVTQLIRQLEPTDGSPSDSQWTDKQKKAVSEIIDLFKSNNQFVETIDLLK